MRADRLFETLDQGASESCLLTDLADIRWLTGFSGSHAWLVVHNHSMHLLTDGRYVDQAQAEIFQHQAEVEMVEPMGADSQVWCRLAGREFRFRTEGLSTMAKGSKIAVGFDPGRASLFDASTELRI